MAVPRIDILADDAEGYRRASFLYSCHETFARDLTKTKTTENKSERLGGTDVIFDEDGKIKRADEWMSTRFFQQPIDSHI